MPRNLLRSIGAVVMACLIAVAAVALAPLIFLPIVEHVSPAYLESHAQVMVAVAYVFGVVLVAVLAGVAVGQLAPTHPAMHMLTAAVVLELAGLALSGARALPHGWQILGFALQLSLGCAVAVLAWSRRHREPAPTVARAA